MLIIADTGPLITFIQIEQFPLLEKLFPDFVLPAEVFEELIKYEPIRKFNHQITSIETRIKKPKQLLSTVEELDKGELACISLYYELKADAILIEDRTARNWAEEHGINCLGSIAILIKAKRSGLISAIKSLLLEMKKHKRFISDELFFKTIKDEGED